MLSAKGLELFLCSPLLDLSGIKRALASMGIRVRALRDQGEAVSVCNVSAGQGSRKRQKVRHVVLIDEAFGDGGSGGLLLLDVLRGQLGLRWPVIVTSFQSLERIRRTFTRSPFSVEPTVLIGQGTYFLQMPFLLHALKQLLLSVQSVAPEEVEKMGEAWKIRQAEILVKNYLHNIKTAVWTDFNKQYSSEFMDKRDETKYRKFLDAFNDDNKWRKGKRELERRLETLGRMGFKETAYPVLDELRQLFGSLEAMKFPAHYPVKKKERDRVNEMVLQCMDIFGRIETLGKG